MKESCEIFRPQAFDRNLDGLIENKLSLFQKITKRYLFFHFLFGMLAVAELLTLLIGLSFFPPTTLLALVLAAFFLTAFSYFVLLFYFQAKKPEELRALKEEFALECSIQIPFAPASPEYHLALAHGLGRFVTALEGFEYTCLSFPIEWKTLTIVLQKLSAWCHWRDVHKMQECLLLSAIDEQISLIKQKPTDLEAHSALGKAYLNLSLIYKNPEDRGDEKNQTLPWVSSAFSQPQMHQKFLWACKRAVEEFQILSAYTPNDPWVHSELASIYHHLEMADKEIAEYEKIRTIAPYDSSALFRLGILYFEQGESAKALAIYEELQRRENPRAQELIAYYDAFALPESFSR